MYKGTSKSKITHICTCMLITIIDQMILTKYLIIFIFSIFLFIGVVLFFVCLFVQLQIYFKKEKSFI